MQNPPAPTRDHPGPGTSARAALERSEPRRPARSLYIHIPFCFHKCDYCDFYSVVDRRDRQEAFTDRLCAELAALAPWAGLLRTIFIGGGTPTLLRPDLWERLLARLHRAFDLSLMHGGRGGEFTVECNPETARPELFDILASGGVNRLSVGAQSFNPAHLKTLERWHDPDSVGRALDMARKAGIRRLSIDLIFGIPGQDPGDWRADLAAALALGTEHLSCYDLTYEPGTALTRRLELGLVTPADEHTEVEMYRLTLETLRDAGLHRYEVSNYARPGAECRHNLAYWRQDDWLAAGPSASAHIGGHRWKNVPRLDDYLSFSDDGLPAIVDHEGPDARRALAERIMTGLRLAEGIESAPLLAGAGAESGARLERIAARQAAARRMEFGAGRWRLTDEGFLFADGIAAELMAALG